MKRLLRFFLFIFMFSAVTLFSLFFVNAGCIHSDEYIGDTLAEVLVKEPTCTEEGYTLFLCSVCDGFYESMRKPVTGHDFSADEKRTNMVLNDDNTHSYYCLNCYKCVGTASEGIDGKESCSFSLASYEKETCTQLGVKVYMCDICYRSKEETVGVKQHIYSKIRKLPTCTEKGYDMFTCKECGDSYKDNYTDVKEHISDGGKLEVIPTYDNGGVLKYSCRVCDYVIGRENVPKLTKYVKKPAPEKVKGFKVKSADSSSVKLVWNKSSSASSYKIYYSTDKKKWKTKTTKKNSLVVKELKSSRKYYFKIKAVSGNGESPNSTVISTYTKPDKVGGLKVGSKSKGVCTLGWTEQKRADGYEVSYSLYKFTKKKSIKTVTVTKGSKKTLKKLKRGKKYYVRVRAFKIVNKKKVYGKYSDTKTVTIR